MQYLAAPTMESKILEILSRLRLARVARLRPALGLNPYWTNTKQPDYCLSFDVKQIERNKT